MRSFESLFCERCGFVRHFTKPQIDHKFHLGATLFTFGLWGLVWLVLFFVEARRPWRCSICGSRYMSKLERSNAVAESKHPRKNRLIRADY